MTLPYSIPYPYTQAGENRYQIHPPETYDDGDHVVVFIKHDEQGWFLSDEGHAAMMYDCPSILDMPLSDFGQLWAEDIRRFVQCVVAVVRAAR